jgi:DNA-directed RNA polymerase specialized sigma24 family protein
LQELELIQRLKQGEERAFQELVAAYQDRVYNTALSLLQDPADAEDVTQEVFIHVFQRIREYRGATRNSAPGSTGSLPTGRWTCCATEKREIASLCSQ